MADKIVPMHPTDRLVADLRIRESFDPLATKAANEIERLQAIREEMARALEKAGHQFAFYAKMHREKGTSDGEAKARTNDEYARLCDAALSKHRDHPPAVASGGSRRE